MKSISVFLILALSLCLGCAPALDLESERNALLAADKAWSETIHDTNAFLSFVADGAHFMPFGAPLAQGEAIGATWNGLTSMPGFSLEWQATGAEVAASGDIGYTIGGFNLITELDGTAMLTEGKYVTIWSKQTDGSWKVQVDCFNANGPPTAP